MGETGSGGRGVGNPPSLCTQIHKVKSPIVSVLEIMAEPGRNATVRYLLKGTSRRLS